ncbi:unnamed protein product [Arabis nemorensis]|uniref:Uncharacterized protein n=1 Tax=Arabis nemorensis TaxID=586526 RepID=A0A565BWP1_9BRAS|nr:unnamed protein product [Arabis nemorensis]
MWVNSGFPWYGFNPHGHRLMIPRFETIHIEDCDGDYGVFEELFDGSFAFALLSLHSVLPVLRQCRQYILSHGGGILKTYLD